MTSTRFNFFNSVVGSRTGILVCAALLSACASKVPLSSPTPVQQRTNNDASRPVKPDVYLVQRGDSLSSIAQRYQVSVADINKWNNLAPNHSLQAGQALRLVPPAGAVAASGTSVVPPGTASAPVVTGSIKQAGIETKPLETKPLEAKPSDTKSTDAKPVDPKANEARPAESKLSLKTGPRGTKRPYSDALFAEMSGVPLAKDDKAKDAAKSTGNWVWPSNGKVVQTFQAPKANGLWFSGKAGDPINAVADGTVIFSGEGPRGFGNLVIVKHSTDVVSVYGNNKTLLVKEGQAIKKGTKLAEMGSSGTDKTQLIFEIRQAGKPVDPSKFLVSREPVADNKVSDTKAVSKSN